MIYACEVNKFKVWLHPFVCLHIKYILNSKDLKLCLLSLCYGFVLLVVWENEQDFAKIPLISVSNSQYPSYRSTMRMWCTHSQLYPHCHSYTVKPPPPSSPPFRLLKGTQVWNFFYFFAETESLWSQGPVTRDFWQSYSIRPRYLTFKHFRVCSVSD